MGPGLGSTRDERHSFLLRNAHVDIVLAQCLATLLRQATHGRYSTLDDEKLVVELSFLHEVLSEQVCETLATANNFRLSSLQVERHTPVPGLFVFHSGLIAVTFLCMQMNDDGMVDVLDLAESLNKLLNIVARFHIHIVEAKRAEYIVATLAVALTQC